MGPLARLGVLFRRGFGRVTPDPFVLAVGLSVVVLLAGLFAGDWPGATLAGAEGAEPGPMLRLSAALEAWASTGLWKLLAFGMQAVIMLVLGTALAEAPIVRRGITALTRFAKGPRSLVAITALASITLALFSWSLSLIGGAILAREGGRQAKLREWKLHYPLLCAAAYSGLMCWHGGMSGTAPLKATTEKDMIEVLGPELAASVGTLGLDETLFGPLNLFVSLGLLVLGPLVFAAMTPAAGKDPDPAEIPPEVEAAASEAESPFEPAPADAVEAIERSPYVVWALGFPMLAALVMHLAREGVSRLDLNTINMTLWVLALLLHGRPHRFLAACARGIQGCTGIVLQFPLYAGIMAVMAASGLSVKVTELVSAAGPKLLAPLTFVTAGALNLLVPSGGGQWAVQGPIIMQAALDTGVDASNVLMAMAYGDQWTNMLQPFWALPLLAVTGVRARDIVGYTALWMILGGLWMLLGLAVLT